MYTEIHTKKVLEDERKKLNSELAGLKAANAKTDREIRQAKTFTSKKDDEHRKLKEELEVVHEKLNKLNDDIVKRSLKLDYDTRRHNPDDAVYVDSYATKLEDAKTEKTAVEIDRNIAQARVNELTSQKQALMKKITDILKDKVKLDKEIAQKENQRQGKGATEAENRVKQVDKEREQAMKLGRSNEVDSDKGQKILQVILAEEEKKAKDLLDQKITADQDMETLTEKADKMGKDRKDLRQELIEKKLKLSMLQSANKSLTEEEKELTKVNADLQKDNAKFEKENEELMKSITILIQHIDVSTLLKSIDIEEMKMFAKNNDQLSTSFIAVLNAWENIIKNS